MIRPEGFTNRLIAFCLQNRLVVALLLTRWMGWHLAFLPAFVTELIPIANFIPSWTLAMWIVTKLRGRKQP